MLADVETGVITCAAVVAMTAGLLALGFWTASQEDRTESATSYAADDEPGSGPEAGTDVWELREGDCYLTEGLTEVVRTASSICRPAASAVEKYCSTARTC